MNRSREIFVKGGIKRTPHNRKSWVFLLFRKAQDLAVTSESQVPFVTKD